MPRLIVNLGSSPAWQIDLKPGTNSIGRGSTNDFVIPDPSVSSAHCQILVSDESVVLRDLHSTNGTYVNRAPVQEAVLQTGQVIHLGGVKMSYVAEGGSVGAAAGTSASAQPAPVPITPKRVSTVSIPVRAVPARGPVAVPAGGAAPATAAPAVRVSVAPARQPQAQLGAQAQPQPVALAVPPPQPQPARALGIARPAVAVAAAEGAGPAGGGASFAAPAPIAAPVPIAPGQPLFCKSHPKTQARFFCPTCQHGFCELCVSTRPGALKKNCRHCGTECVQIQLATVQRANRPKGFFAMLPDAFVYPFRGSGVLILIAAAIVLGALNFMAKHAFLGWALLFWVMAVGYFFAYMQNILHSTAAGDPELPPMPSMSDFWSDILLPCLQMLGLTLVCFGPAVALGLWRVNSEETAVGIAIIPAVILGILYFPMAFLAVAMLDTIFAANPIQVIPSILKVPLEYLVTIVLLAIVFGTRALGYMLLPQIFPSAMISHDMSTFLGFVALNAVWGVASLYLLTVNVRLLGLLYFTSKEKLGWFNR